jgi:hypothetical protein
MFETQTSIPPEAGGIFLSTQEQRDTNELIEKYEIARLSSDSHKAKLLQMLPDPNLELAQGKKTYQAWVDEYARQKGAYWTAQQLAAIDILLPGVDNACSRQRVKKALYGDPREVASADRESARDWLTSQDLSSVLAGAGVVIEYEPPNPYLEMRISYTEDLKEQAAMGEDMARTIRRQGGGLRERIVEGCLDNLATGIEIESKGNEHRYFIGHRGYITEYDWEDDRVIHYYDGQLDSYDGHRNSNVTDDVRMLGAVANASQILFTSGKIVE